MITFDVLQNWRESDLLVFNDEMWIKLYKTQYVVITFKIGKTKDRCVCFVIGCFDMKEKPIFP